MMIAKILCSELRRDAMLKMLGGPIRAADIGGDEATSNKIGAIRPLLKAGYIEKIGYDYCLTGPGRIIALQAREMADAMEVMKHDFWRLHDLSSIPDRLLMRIGALKGGGVIEPNGLIMKAQKNFIDILTHAKRIWGASSFNLEGYSEMVTTALENGAEIDLILSPACIQSLRHEDILAWRATGRFRLHVREVKAALAVADDTLSLGLFDFSGTYDPLQDYVCQSEAAAEWGRELLEYYLRG